MNCARGIILLSAAVLLLGAVDKVAGVTCNRTIISILEGGAGGDCLNTYVKSGASPYFNDIVMASCRQFTALNFTNFTSLSTIGEEQNWATYFNACAHDSDFFLSGLLSKGGNSGSVSLLSTKCLQYGSNSLNDCSCQMDCLLQFNLHRYIFLEGIICDETLFNSSLSIYNRDSFRWSNFTQKDGFPNCTDIDTYSSSVTSMIISTSTPAVIPTAATSSIISLSSSLTLSSSITFTTATTSTPFPSPSSTPPTVQCPVNYTNIGNEYCSGSWNCSNNTPFAALLDNSCQHVNESFHIQSTDHQQLDECVANETNSSHLLIQALSSVRQCNNEWIVTNFTCQCASHNCSFLSSTCLSNCLVKITNERTLYILFTGLASPGSYQLITDITRCANVTVAVTNGHCCPMGSTVSLSPTPSVPSIDKPLPFYQSLYFQAMAASIGGLILISVTLLAAVCLIIRVKRRQHRSKHFTPPLAAANKCINSPLNSTSQLPLAPASLQMAEQFVGEQVTVNYVKWKQLFAGYIVNYSQITIIDTIGEGAFGLVQKGSLLMEDGKKLQVAIKAMKNASCSEQVEEFMSESAIMLDFDHPNVLKLLGVCFDTEDQLPVIILPYMANGDLKSYLQSKRRNAVTDGLSISLLIRMCLDICTGMEYLSKKKFVHRDLAARNCMVDEELLVQVADFGLSRDIYSRDYYRLERRAKLPVKWLPPESLHDNIYNEKTDVWSFGVTCWEIFSLGKSPYPGIDNADVLDYIERGIRLAKPSHCPKEMYLLLSQCWDESQEVRPCFSDLLERIHTIHCNWQSYSGSFLQLKMKEMMNSSSTGGDLPKVRSASCSTPPPHSPHSPSHHKLRHSQCSDSSLIKTHTSAIEYMIPESAAAQQENTSEYNHLNFHQPTTPQSQTYNYLTAPPTEAEVTIGFYGSNGRAPSLENFGRTLERGHGREEEGGVSPVPLFEKLYDTSKKSGGNESQHSGAAHTTSNGNLPMNNGPTVRRTPEGQWDDHKLPMEYSIPVTQKSSKNRHSSKSSTAPLLCSTSTNASHPESPEGHFYFTLERRPAESPPVFEGDADSNRSSTERKDSSESSSEDGGSPSVFDGYRDTSFQLNTVPRLATGRLINGNSSLLGSNQVPLQQFYVMEQQ